MHRNQPPQPAPSLVGTRVLVTGATGFLGSHLVWRLLRERATLACLVRGGESSQGRFTGFASQVTLIPGNLEDREALASQLRTFQPGCVFHLAGRVDLARTAEITEACVRENILATANLLWALQGIPLRSLIYSSTTEVYGNQPTPFHEAQVPEPPSPYAVSKLAAEHLCRFFVRAHGYPISVLRFSTVYGPGQAEARLIPAAILAILRGSALAMTDGRHRRDVLYVDDAVDGLVRAATTPAAWGETMNLGHDRVMSLREIIDIIRRLMDTSWEPAYGALPPRPNEPAEISCRWEKAKQLLGWQPMTPLEEGLRQTIEGYRKAFLAESGKLRTPAEPVMP